MSVSEKQLEANRRNALRSCGPRSEAGKAIVSQNATSHGLLARHVVIDGESQREFDIFHEEMVAELKPVGMLECSLLDKIASSIWRQHRARRIENQIMESLCEPVEEKKKESDDGHWLHTKDGRPFSVIVTQTYEDKPDEYEIYGMKSGESQASPGMENEKCGMENEDSDLGPRQIDKSNEVERNSSEQTAVSKRPERLSLGRAVRNDIEGSNILQKFQRYASEIDRALYKAIREFDRLQERRIRSHVIEAEVAANDS